MTDRNTTANRTEAATMITISKEDYLRLRIDSAKLSMLERGGVDNWDWYGQSLNPDDAPSLDDVEAEIESEVAAMLDDESAKA